MRRGLAAGVAVLLLTACGTTVQQGPTSAGGQPAGDGLSITGEQAPALGADGAAPQGLGSSDEAGAGGGGAAPAAGAAPGGSRSGGTRAGSSAGSPAQSDGRPAAVAAGPGVTADKVRIGFQYVDTGGGTDGFLGQNVSLGDPQAQARAVRDWVNKNGGLGGRKLEVVPYGAPYAGYVNNPQQEYNRICTYYTEDQAVFGVAAYVPDETLISCLARRDVVMVANGYAMDRQVHSRYARHFYAPSSMSQDRGAEVGVEGLASIDFFRGAKIGLLRYDSGVYVRAEKSLVNALARKGLKISSRFELSSANASEGTRDAQAAVLKFRADGVTHVLVLDNSGGIAYAFMTSAESQSYRPFYALTTNNSPSALRQLAPPGQLVKSAAVSWWWGDVGPEEDQATPPAIPQARYLCEKIMKAAGVDLSGRAALGSALLTCDQFFFFKSLFDRAAAPTSAGVEQAADRLGAAHGSTLAYTTRIGPGRHDGATVTRIIRYDTGCQCYKYVRMGPRA